MSIATATIMGEVIEADHLIEEARETLARASDAINHALKLSTTGGYRVSQHEALLRFVISRQWAEMIMWRRALGDVDSGIQHPAGRDVIADMMAFMAGQPWLSPEDEIRAWFGGGR